MGTMGARTHEDLTVWKLSSELRDKIVRLSAQPRWADDRRFRDQTREAVAAVPANIAEGFGRYSHADFARFLTIARGSLAETLTHLDDAKARGYVESTEADMLRELADRTQRSLVSLLRYLQTTETP